MSGSARCSSGVATMRRVGDSQGRLISYSVLLLIGLLLAACGADGQEDGFRARNLAIPDNGATTFWECVEQATANEDYAALQACQDLYEPEPPVEPTVYVAGGGGGFADVPGSGTKGDPWVILSTKSGYGWKNSVVWAINDPDNVVASVDTSGAVSEVGELATTPIQVSVECIQAAAMDPPATGTIQNHSCQTQSESLEPGSYVWVFSSYGYSGEHIGLGTVAYFDVVAPLSLDRGANEEGSSDQSRG